LILVYTAMIVLSLSGCSCTTVSTKNQLINYANNNFGKAKLIDYKKEEDLATAIFQDAEYGFTYTVTSYTDSFSIDGSSFGTYEDKGDTYTESFIAYIKPLLENDFLNIEDKYKCTIEWNKYYSSKQQDSILIYVYLANETDNEKITRSLGKIIEEIDIRNHFNKGIIYGKYNDEFVGKYSFSTKTYINSEDSEIKWAMENAYQIMKIYKNVSIDTPDELTYINSEEMDANNIPGISNETISYRITDTEDSLKHTKVYYYKFENEMWLIADCLVAPYNNLYVYKLD